MSVQQKSVFLFKVQKCISHCVLYIKVLFVGVSVCVCGCVCVFVCVCVIMLLQRMCEKTIVCRKGKVGGQNIKMILFSLLLLV